MGRQGKSRSFAKRLSVFACLATAPLVSACAKPAPVSHQVATYTAPAATAAAQEPEKKPRFGDAAVYVDGLAVGVVRARELPPSLLPLSLDGIGDSKIYCLRDYVAALGLDLAKVRGVQIYGGKRVSVLDGDEFRRVGGKIRFAFTGNDRGKAGLLWPHEKLKINTVVGTLSSLTIYVDKAPPALNADGALVYADGTLVSGVPYAPAEQGKGTRVYVDGKLAGIVKRKSLPSSLLVGDDRAHPKFSMTAYLSSINVNPQDAKAIDFVSNDDTFLRVPASQWEKAKTLTFTIPAHSQGQIAMPRPSSDDSDSGTLKVSAVQLFVKLAPPVREISVPASSPSGGDGAGSGDGKPEDSALE